MNTNDTPPATRAEAKARGLKHYFTGRPCSKGHVVNRHITGTCVDCQQIAIKAWDKRNPGEGLRRSRKWQKAHPERAKENTRRSWRKRNGVPFATRPCPANCESCSRVLEGGIKTHLDHCHITGVFRGWLCNRCNRGLGYFGDSIEGIEKALTYLKQAYALASSTDLP